MVIIPDKGVGELSLNGSWEFMGEEPGCCVQIPGDLYAMGIHTVTDQIYEYRRLVHVPEEFMGKRIFLELSAIHDDTQILVDKETAAVNQIPYMDCHIDLTKQLKPGKTAEIVLRCLSRSDSVSSAPRRPGDPGMIGFLHNMRLVALEQSFFTVFRYEIEWPLEQEQRAVLKLHMEAEIYPEDNISGQLVLMSQDGKEIFSESCCLVRKANKEAHWNLSVPMKNPCLWDTEHPYLYRLSFRYRTKLSDRYYENGWNVGVRSIQKRKNELYINGKRTKLHGITRYSLDPIQGKQFTPKQIDKEIRLMKEANINFIRLSVYPEQKAYYECCDKYGIYLQVCAPVTFQQERYDTLGFPVVRHSCDKPKYRERYLAQFSYMVESLRNHPSIIFWEFANESDWGSNLKAEVDYARHSDPGRLTTGTWKNSHADINAYHYPLYNEIYQDGSVYDEYTHISTHALGSLCRDPGIRNAWGLSIKKGWDALYEAKGVIGTGIFALGDFVLMFPDGRIGNGSFGQWGIIDKWMRKKPEHWLVKKAYSPIRTLCLSYQIREGQKYLEIPVYNRFNTTNLKEIEAQVYQEDDTANTCMVIPGDIAPGTRGSLRIPLEQFYGIKKLTLCFCQYGKLLLDKETLSLYYNREETEKEGASGGGWETYKEERKSEEYIQSFQAELVLEETDDSYLIKDGEFQFTVNKKTGLFSEGSCNGEKLIESGPYLNFKGLYYKSTAWPRFNDGDFGIDITTWRMDSLQIIKQENMVKLLITGRYSGQQFTDADGRKYGFDEVVVCFEVIFCTKGRFLTSCKVYNPPAYLCCEMGIRYLLSADIRKYDFRREALYSCYPEEHIGRQEGTAWLYRKDALGQELEESYRKPPVFSWSYDEKDFILRGCEDWVHGTNDFRASRENLIYACASAGNRRAGVAVSPEERGLILRMGFARDEDSYNGEEIAMNLNHVLYYDLGGGSLPGRQGDMAWGNYTYEEKILPENYEVRVELFLKREIEDCFTNGG